MEDDLTFQAFDRRLGTGTSLDGSKPAFVYRAMAVVPEDAGERTHQSQGLQSSIDRESDLVEVRGGDR